MKMCAYVQLSQPFRKQRGAAQHYLGSILNETYHLFLRLYSLFAVLMGLIGLGPVVNASLKHSTGWWLLAQTALPAMAAMSSTGSLRYNKLL